MALTTYGTASAETVKLWSRKLFHEALKSTWASKFMGKDSNSLIQVVEDTSKGPGDRVRVTLRMLLSGAGIAGDGTLEGNEEALTSYTDNLFVDQLRHAVRSAGRMSEQRVPFDLRQESMRGLADWWSDRIDTAFFNQIAGIKTVPSTATVETVDLRYTGANTPTEPDTAHIKVAGTADTTAFTLNTSQSLSTWSFKVSLIDDAVAIAKTASPAIRPLRVNGEDYFVCFLHPRQVRDMRKNFDPGMWGDIQQAAMQGGKVSDNPIFTGALGVYNGTILHESARVPQALDDSGTVLTHTRRAIFCGAQAAIMAFGRGYAGSRINWTEEQFDYRNQLGVSASMIWGIKKTVFNSADFATIALDTQAVA